MNGLVIRQSLRHSIGDGTVPPIQSSCDTTGRLAAQEILQRLEYKHVTRRQHDVGFELLVEDST